MTDTSAAAYESLTEPTLANLKKRVYDYIASRPQGEATCDEVEIGTGLSHQTASARVRDLVKAGLIVDTGARRPTRSGRGARVYRKV